MTERDNERDDQLRAEGMRFVYEELFQFALRGLGISADRAYNSLLQLTQARTALRALCADFGDNDWPDNLHLADVITKHLGQHLYASAPDNVEDL